MAARRYSERPRTRKSGAGRPRKTARGDTGPVDLAIVGAAARLFARQGVTATTMAEVADEVGLGVSSIYYYFANKHEILERIVDDVNRVPLAIAAQVGEMFDDAPRRLHAFVRNDAAALCEFPFDINEVHRLAADERDLFADYWADRRRLIQFVEEVVHQGIEAGDFREVDPALSALTILSNDEAVQNWFRAPITGDDVTDRSADDVGLFVADLALRGLLLDTSLVEAIGSDTAALIRPPVELG